MVAETVPRVVGGAILATGGWGLGEYISDTWGPELYVPWVFGLSSAGVILGLLATPHAARWAVRTLIRQLESTHVPAAVSDPWPSCSDSSSPCSYLSPFFAWPAGSESACQSP